MIVAAMRWSHSERNSRSADAAAAVLAAWSTALLHKVAAADS